MPTDSDKIEVENVNTPGRTERVNRAKFKAVHDALLSILPTEAPGLTFAEVKEQVRPLLPEDLFPGGATSGWWLKTVQLDQEAKGVVIRETTKPLRFRKTGAGR